MFLITSDNVKIAYDWYSAENPSGFLVLVHMMPATKESWRGFAGFAKKNGYSSIAIDLRGHGQSDGGPTGYQKLKDEGHQKSILDLEAAVDYVKTQGAKADQIFLAGASIGANLSLQYLANHPEIKKAVLLSAGLNYRGIKTEPLLKNLKSDQKVLAIASRDDDDNLQENEKLFGEDYPDMIVYERGGHGTAIIESQKELPDKIINFLSL